MIELVRAIILVVGLVGATVSARPIKKCAYSDYRLPRRIVPRAYNLRLDVNTEQLSYSGSLEIELKIKKNNDVDKNIIVLNVHPDVRVSEVTYFDVFIDPESGTNKDSIKVNEICRDDENELLVITLAENLADQSTGQLSMSFKAKIRDDNTGIYRSKYTTQAGLDGYHVSTDFKPNKARRAFPCFDEPSFKATFTIELTHDPAKVALANTELLSEAISNGRKVSRFQTTPLMSSYLVAFAIGEFHYIESKVYGERLKIKAYTSVGKSQQAQFALDTAVNAIMYLEEYFNIPFPLKKLDLVSVVHPDSTETEGWGLIVCNETPFLFDSVNMSPISKGDIAKTVIQAVTKQWFGNLVTLEWWDDLWLQEGFAGWMANSLIERMYPKLQWELNYLIETHLGALKRDIGGNARPIRVSVDRTNLNSISNDLVHFKSAAVIRMLHDDYVKPDKFKIGIRQYLGDNKHGNVDAIQLWKKMTTLSGLPVGKFIESWIRPPGHPSVSAKLSPDGSRLILEQRPERPIYSSAKRNTKDPVWIIPVTILLSDGKDQQVPSTYIFDKDKLDVDFPGWFDINKDPNHWLKVNAYSRGFYRAHHTSDIVLPRLRRPCKTIQLSSADRISLIDDMEAQARSRVSRPSKILRVLEWFEWEKEDGSVLGWTARVSSHLQPHNELIKKIFTNALSQIKLSNPLLKNVGTSDGLGVADGFGLVTTYSILLEMNYLPLVYQALTIFNKETNTVAPIMRELVYKAVALYGSSEQRNTLQSFLKREDNCEEEINRIDAALALVPGVPASAATSYQGVRERPEVLPERIKRPRLA